MNDRAQDLRSRLNNPRLLVAVLGLEDGSKSQAGGVIIRCPFHDERNASCSVTVGPDGTIRFRCHSCDATGDAFHLIAKAKRAR